VDDQDDVIEVIGEVSRWCWVAEGHHSSHVVALVRDELRPAVRSLLLTVRQGAIERAERSITTSGGAVVVSVCQLDDRAAAAGEPGSGAMVVSFVEPPPPVARSGTGPPGSGDPDAARMLRELASTEAALQATIEQLSITNEEFQALNEELQAASEELQASNEEVHASNEELEATNEELSSLNLELEHRGNALATANADLENIQASLTSGLVLLDRDLRITRYTPLAVRLFALIATDVGRPLTAIPSTIEIPDLELRLREAVEEKKDGLLELHGDRNDVLLHFHPYRGRDGAVLGAILVSTDISEVAAAHRAAERSLRDLVAVTDALREAVWQRTEDGRLLFMNSQVEYLFGLNRRHVIEDPHLMLAAVHPEDRERVAMAAAAHPAEPYSMEYRIVRRGQVRWVHEAAVVVPPDGSGAGYIVASALDVTDTHHVEERAGEHLETLEAVFHNTVFGVLVLDSEDRVVRANDRIVRMSGYDHASLVGMPVRLVIQDTQPLDPFADVEIAPDPTAPLTLGIAHRRLVGRNGLPYFVTMEIRQLSSGDGGARIVIVHDVTRLHEANLELAARALFDQNTGLLVRSYFREQLSRELARSDRSGAGLAVLWIDLDGFKAVNDRYGHQAGDIVLREVARRLQHASRRQDAVGRLGGDEFAMLVTDIDQADGLEAVAQRVLAVLREPIRLSDSQVYLSGSMGVAVAPEDGDDPDALLHSADTAMYAAKQAGHDRRVYFRADLNHAAEKRAGTRHDLAVAMRARQFVMHYQPVISTATGEVCSVEALIRWTREDGIVPAADFMAVAEQTGQLRAIGRIALDLIDEDLHTLRAEPGYEQLAVCVNLSPAQLEERDLLDWLVAWEPDGGFDRLVIEVTEAAALARGGRPVETLTLLRKLGARLSIDDFGTGYSNLALLDRLRPSIIKIDRTLLSRAENQPRGHAVLLAAVQLVHALDAQVVVEGVENEHLWRLACSLGAEQMQGFHLARPMSLPDLIGWIGRHEAGISGSG
jgi:two-component system CheB/CheR fusion protein